MLALLQVVAAKRRNGYAAVGVCALLAVLLPSSVLADCAPGSIPMYSDIESVAVRRCGVVGPMYRFIASDTGFIWFNGIARTSVLGSYSGGDGKTLLKTLIELLQRYDFYAMRLRRTPVFYLDGPCETIEVMRCGVATAIGGLGVDLLPFEADVEDPQTSRFNALLNELQAPILAWPWAKEAREPTPAPSP